MMELCCFLEDGARSSCGTAALVGWNNNNRRMHGVSEAVQKETDR